MFISVPKIRNVSTYDGERERLTVEQPKKDIFNVGGSESSEPHKDNKICCKFIFHHSHHLNQYTSSLVQLLYVFNIKLFAKLCYLRFCLRYGFFIQRKSADRAITLDSRTRINHFELNLENLVHVEAIRSVWYVKFISSYSCRPAAECYILEKEKFFA